ncbi:MAG: polysaccharide deacetylase family protein [Roseburia sp.]
MIRIHIFQKEKWRKKSLLFILTTLLTGIAIFGISGAVRQAIAESEVLAGQTAEAAGKEMMKKIAITFDDGPNPNYTEELLDGLKERGVNATFFLLGKEVETYPEIVKRIYEEGHLIGTHSYEHVNLSNLCDSAAIEQVDKTNTAIYHITGEYPQYIRPPFGCWKCNLDYETTMVEVLWDIDPLDWKTDNSDVVTERVVSKVQEGDIILLHDASESSVKAAFQIIDELEQQGYQFVTVEELIFE